jgi:hypothetical protein
MRGRVDRGKSPTWAINALPCCRWHRACNPAGTSIPTHAQEKRMLSRHHHVFITMALATASACSAESGPTPVRLTDTSYSSECGGFEGQASVLQPAGAYCDAEVIHWSYDDATGTLSYLHTRASTNCCAERKAHAQLVGTEYQIVETEYPLYPGGACGCGCVLDVGLDVPISDGPTVELTVLLEDEKGWGDKQPVRTQWSGTLDLAAGAGEIVLSTVGVMGCDRALQ